MKKLVFLCFLFLSDGVLAMELYADIRADRVYVYLHNNSSEEILVNSRFAAYNLKGPSELAFIFADSTGKYVDYSYKGVSYATEEYFNILRPDGIVGTSIELGELAWAFTIPPGSYQLTVIYKNYSKKPAGAFMDELGADPIAVEVTKAQSEGVGRLILRDGVMTRDGIVREYQPLVDHPRR